MGSSSFGSRSRAVRAHPPAAPHRDLGEGSGCAWCWSPRCDSFSFRFAAVSSPAQDSRGLAVTCPGGGGHPPSPVWVSACACSPAVTHVSPPRRVLVPLNDDISSEPGWSGMKARVAGGRARPEPCRGARGPAVPEVLFCCLRRSRLVAGGSSLSILPPTLSILRRPRGRGGAAGPPKSSGAEAPRRAALLPLAPQLPPQGKGCPRPSFWGDQAPGFVGGGLAFPWELGRGTGACRTRGDIQCLLSARGRRSPGLGGWRMFGLAPAGTAEPGQAVLGREVKTPPARSSTPVLPRKKPQTQNKVFFQVFLRTRR